MKTLRTLFHLAMLFASIFTNVEAQTNEVPNLLAGTNSLLGTASAGVGRVAEDGYNVFKTFSLTNPISAGVVGLKNGSHYGGGIVANTANPDSLVNVGFGVFAIQDDQTTVKNGVTSTKTEWGFYDATLNLSVSQVEKIPVLNIPVTLMIESGPAVRLTSGGNALLEQSAAFGDVTFAPIKAWPITFGAGVIHCSAFSQVMPMFHLNLTHTF